MAPSSISKRASSPSPTKGMQSPTARSSNQVGSVKLKKVERKAKEQLMATLQELSTRIGKLEDRDTQQQAFQSLVESLPQLSPSLVNEFYSLIEKNKRPSRSSTRRMLVLLIAVLCKCHPLQSTKLLPRITAYIGTRLRDNEAKVTEACGILVSSIALHVIPHCGSTCDKLDHARPQSVENGGLDKWTQVFENMSAPLVKDANAIGENATRCLCALLRPTEFDGQTPPSKENLLAHATRVISFFKTIVSASVSKMNGSTIYASFSSTFLLLKAACEIASDARVRTGFRELSDVIVPYVGFVIEAIEDVFQYGPRDDWVLRKHGMELLTLLIEGFGLSEDEAAASAIEYFHTNLERIRSLVLAGRQDPVSSVREAAIQTVVAFDKLNKRYGDQSPVKRIALAYHQPSEFSARSNEPYRSKEPSIQPDRKASAKKTVSDEEMNDAPEAKLDALSEDQEFGDLGMDEAAAPDLQHVEDQEQEIPTLPAKTQVAAHTSSPLKQFVAKKRVQVSKLLEQQRKQIPHISPPKALSRKSVDEFEFPPETGDMSESPREEEDSSSGDDKEQVVDESDELASMSRAEAALSAAQCEEYDLAFRLCLLEDDVTLLKQVMGVIGAPCMHQLSRASRSALCAAFLEILDPAAADRSHDQWLVFAWLHDLSMRTASLQQVDPRVLRALEQRLEELSAAPTKAGLEAAGVLAQLDLYYHHFANRA